jgi:hypothetical protein
MLRQAEKEREEMMKKKNHKRRKKLVTLKLNFNMGSKFSVKDHSAISIAYVYAV